MPLPLAPWLLKKHWAAFHTLDRCRLPLSTAQPNDKSRLPGELAAMTPALHFATPGLASCQGGDPGTSSRRRDCGWSWARVDSGSCPGLTFQNVLHLGFWFCLLDPFPSLSRVLPQAFGIPPSHQSQKSDKLMTSTTPGSPRLPAPCPGPLGRKRRSTAAAPAPRDHSRPGRGSSARGGCRHSRPQTAPPDPQTLSPWGSRTASPRQEFTFSVHLGLLLFHSYLLFSNHLPRKGKVQEMISSGSPPTLLLCLSSQGFSWELSTLL